MQMLVCPQCRHQLYFDNSNCLNCCSAVAFDSARLEMILIKPGSSGIQQSWFGRRRRTPQTGEPCKNAGPAACNWSASQHLSDGFCRSCALNHTIPDLSNESNLSAWRIFEQAKKRLVYSLIRFRLPFDQCSGATQPLRTSLLQDGMTGHARGTITIALEETDAVEREKQRQDFNEPYRTLLGHLRHESGHYFWDRLIRNGPLLQRFREEFDDERENYQNALQHHYDNGPKLDWTASFISAYASVHPWEDWAESWAHYFHMIDVIDTARNHAIPFTHRRLHSNDAYQEYSFETLMSEWVTLTVTLNELSRSMGHDDFYPFVIPVAARQKLAFIHRIIRSPTQH